MKTNDELLDILWDKVNEAGSQKKVADEIGISAGFLNDILQGRAPVTDQVARYLGYKKVKGFVKDGH